MTLQEAFNYVVKGLLSQAHPSAEGSLGTTMCFYRGGENIRCGVGWLIPDSMYSSDMEYMSIDEVLDNFPDLAEAPMIRLFTREELMLLQQYHDDAAIKFCREGNLASDWQRFIREALSNFAADSNLKMEI